MNFGRSKSDWSAHQGLLHQHDNKKFMKPTPRSAIESPVLEVFERESFIVDLLAIIGVVVVLVGGLLLLKAL